MGAAMVKPGKLNPQSERERVRAAAVAICRDLLMIVELSEAASTNQWQPPPNHSDPSETGDIRRPENVHSDPTGDAATDPTRIYLHHAHRNAARALDRIAQQTRQHAVRLDKAHQHWFNAR